MNICRKFHQTIDIATAVRIANQQQRAVPSFKQESSLPPDAASIHVIVDASCTPGR